MTTTKSFDKLNRLTQIRSVDAQSAPVASFDYNYNPASQRTSATNADGSFWSYSYDALGQVTSGRKYWADGTPVLGQQFDYTFDDIGNRKTAVTGGDQWGANKRYQNYTASLLNQYSQRTVPGYADLMGTANSNATVTVQSSTGVSPASRKGEYFRAEVAAQNNATPVWLGLTNIASLTNGSNSDIVTNTTGRLLLVQTPEVFAYDLDGNLLRDGQWTNFWDAENRLIAQETLPAAYGAGAPRQRLEFDYDPQGRRLVKRAYEWVSGNWSLKYAVRFVWDGWNLLAEVNPTNHLGIRSYAWGLDLSGSAQGAGGVGGLLWMAEHGTAQPSTHFAAFDGNGNVAALVDAVAGTVSANYEYGPFGETIRSTGPLAKANPFRFSTKYQDDETDLLYYGYRYLRDGRWLGRDSAEERGGVNLYGFVGNNGINKTDYLGRWNSDVHLDRTKDWAIAQHYPAEAAEAVAVADNGVDAVLGGTSSMPWIGDQSYHFNRNLGVGSDTRLLHANEHTRTAQTACNVSQGNDDPATAALHLGVALHPLQDWVAHGDYFIWWTGPITEIHNARSLQKLPPGWPGLSSLPDTVGLDAVDGPDGRPAGRAIILYSPAPGQMRHGYAVYEGTPGAPKSKRMRKTEDLTVNEIIAFRNYVKAKGGCKCKQYFGIK